MIGSGTYKSIIIFICRQQEKMIQLCIIAAAVARNGHITFIATGIKILFHHLTPPEGALEGLNLVVNFHYQSLTHIGSHQYKKMAWQSWGPVMVQR